MLDARILTGRVDLESTANGWLASDVDNTFGTWVIERIGIEIVLWLC
jgi:hypothetical protein